MQRPAKLAVNIVHHASPCRTRVFIGRNDLVAKRGQRSGFIHRQKSPGSASSATADARTCGRCHRRLQKFPPAEFVCWFHAQSRPNPTGEYAPDRSSRSMTSITLPGPATTRPWRRCDSSKFSLVEGTGAIHDGRENRSCSRALATPGSGASCYTSIQRRILSDAWPNRPSRGELRASEGRLR